MKPIKTIAIIISNTKTILDSLTVGVNWHLCGGEVYEVFTIFLFQKY